MKAGVITFPGSNCDRDSLSTLEQLESEGVQAQRIWHDDAELPTLDLIIVPGGFSYGDYLRSGAMAAHSPIMQEVKKHAEAGRLVLGICNGFQVLTESGLLDGALMRNNKLKFVCKDVSLKVENISTAFTSHYSQGQIITVPVAHHDGNFFADEDTLNRLEDNNQVAFRYVDANGAATDAANPNGSQRNIAGITNKAGNVLGMMPHPERVCDALTGGTDGQELFKSLIKSVA